MSQSHHLADGGSDLLEPVLARGLRAPGGVQYAATQMVVEHPRRHLLESAGDRGDLDDHVRAPGAEAADQLGVPASTGADQVRVEAGGGVAGVVRGQLVRVGSAEWLATEGVDGGNAAPVVQEAAASGHAPIAVGVDGALSLVLGVTDPVRAESAAGVARLRSLGLRVVLASGDRLEVAQALARQVGIDEVRAPLRPEDKAELVSELHRTSGSVAMVGDGINDAPALARAFGYNLVLVPLAMVGVVQPMFAALAMACSSVSVVGNALRLRRQGRTSPRTADTAPTTQIA